MLRQPVPVPAASSPSPQQPGRRASSPRERSPGEAKIRFLEEKVSILQSQLASRDAFIEKLKEENLQWLKEIGRIRLEYEVTRQETVELLSRELSRANEELERMRRTMKSEVSRRVAAAAVGVARAGGKGMPGVPTQATTTTTVTRQARAQPHSEGVRKAVEKVAPPPREIVRADSIKNVSDEYRQREAAQCESKMKEELENVKRCASYSDSPEIILQQCAANAVPFVDCSFPPCQASISRPELDPTLGVMPWMRPSTFLPANLRSAVRIFNCIDPNDIDQGALGDCWFLCSIASIAEFPELVKAIFAPSRNPEEQQVGAYRVRLNKHGWWQDVIVDDYLPTLGGKPCFGATKEDPAELWVALIEKAYAKLHGSYASIAGGMALHALCDLTGLCGWTFSDAFEKAKQDEGAAAELFQQLLQWDGKKYLISLGTPGVDESEYNIGRQGGNNETMKERYKSAGLVNGHAYTVLEARQFPQHNANIVKIRNPWGNAKEWTGDWCDDDPRWQSMPDVATACNFTKADDGTFWMPWKQVLEFFDHGQVCAQGPWSDVELRAKGKFQRGVPSLIFQVTATARTTAMITLSQKDPRGLPKSDPDASRQAMLITVAEPKGSCGLVNRRCSGGSPFDVTEERMYTFSRDISLEFTFLPTSAPHFIIPRIYNKEIEQKEYVLTLRHSRGSQISVECKTFSSSAPPFKNYVQFSQDDCGVTPCVTECQVFLRNAETLNSGVVSDFSSLTGAVSRPAPAAARKQQQSPPPSAQPQSEQPKNPVLRARLTRFYEVYCPEKIPHIGKIMGLYQNRVDDLFERLTTKYGPEPPTEDADDPFGDDEFFDEFFDDPFGDEDNPWGDYEE